MNAGSPVSPVSRSGSTLALAAALFALTLALYGRTAGHGFVPYDDDVYVTENPAVRAGWSAEGVRWAFTTDHAANWHPLTWLSHMLDVELFGLDPGAHHLVSATLHALTAALLLVLFAGMTGAPWTSALAAALFALHPLRVESVAWVAERKDVLAGLFWVTTLLAYAHWVRRPGPWRYAAVLVSFALGLLAKPMLVTLPFVLLLVDSWPLERAAAWRRRLLEKAPLFALAAASSTVTYLVQAAGGAFGPLDRLPLAARVANAFVACVSYLGAMLWPSGLACFYPHPAMVDPAGPGGHRAWGAAALVAALVVALVCAAAVRLRRDAPWLFVGWFWYLGTLVPVLGVVQVGIQARADRYTYVPMIGVAIAIGFAARAAALWRPGLRPAVAVAGAAWLAALIPLTWRQIGTWRDGRALFEHALAVTEKNFMAHNNLGAELEKAGLLDEAAEQYRASLAARPGVAPVHYNLAVVAARRGERAEAVRELRRALEITPDYVHAHVSLGLLLSRAGDDAAAVRHLERALELEPALVAAGQGLAWVLATSPDDAVRDGSRAARVAEACLARSAPPPPDLLEVAAAAFAEASRFEEAVRHQRAACEGLAAAPAVPESARVQARARLSLYEERRPYRKSP